MKPNTLTNPSLPTIPGASVIPGISFLVCVLAKAEKGVGGPSPLRYGNRAQAEKKRESLADCLTREGLSSAVVQVESRFLIAIFPASYDFVQKNAGSWLGSGVSKSGELSQKSPQKNPQIERASSVLQDTALAFQKLGEAAGGAAESVQRFNEARARRRLPFATVSGPRINPRNRHNQGNGAKHVFVSNAPSRLALPIASKVSADPLKDEILRRARLKYKLTGGM